MNVLASAPVDPGRTFALVVTVERYDDPTIADLPGLVESADRFVRWLRKRGVPEENVIRLGGDRPATSGVLDRVLADDIPGLSGDLLWLFWAGHGAIDREGRRRLLTADANHRHLRSVALDDLLRLYRSTYLAHFDAQLAVVDACQTDVPVGGDSLWPAPLALPPAREQMRDRWQRVWLSASAGERAAYAGGNALFSEAVLDLLGDVDHLVWQPDYDTVRAALDRIVSERVDNTYARQHPITLEHGTEKGEWRSTLVRPSGGPAPFQPGSDETLTAHPVVAAYLRWLSLTHERVEAQFAGRRVVAPTAELPWTGGLVPDGSTWHARRLEVDYLRHGAGRPAAELSRLAAQPLPTHLTQIGHVDELDLSGREHVPGESVLDRYWRAIVLGDPGSGKTTLVRALVRRAASAPVDGRWRLPVLCRAVDLAESLASAPDGAVSEVDSRLVVEHAIAVGWLSTPPADPLSGDRIGRADLSDLARRAFTRGRLLLVVDGLDEVPTRAQRAGLVEMLNRLVHDEGPRYGLPTDGTGNQLLVTSRLVGYYATPLAEHVHQLILGHMPPEAVAETGLFWLRRYSETTGKGTQRARAAEDQFRTAVEAGSSDLISNPYLLVSLLSAIVTGEFARREYRNGPLRRSDLYAFMVDDALARAAERRPGLDTAQAMDLQCAVAYAMHRTSRTGVVDPAALRACVEEAVASQPAPDAVGAEHALATVQDLGLLTARGQDLFGFLHQTLEEYLAGRWLVRRGSAAAIRPHLDDPRWVEPIRLGLGHLGRAGPAALDAVLTDLLTGQDATSACAAMIPSLPELRGVGTAHLELMVAALLDADARTGRDLSEAAAALSLLMSSPGTLQDGRRPADVVNHALAGTLTRSAPGMVAAAARAVESLGLFTRETATALFHAQYRDGPEHGWATVRALHTMADATGSTNTGPEAVARVLADLDDTSRHRLAVISLVSVSQPVPGTGRAPILSSLTPFREALTDELLTRIGAEPALTRLVLVLYGGTAFRDWRRWTTEQARLQAVTQLATSDAAVRLAAAVRLDTVVAAALDERADEKTLRPQHMTVDSPLTGDILSCLERDDPVNELGARLFLIAHDEAEDPVRRGDAAVAWSALRAPEPASVENLPGPVMARAVWRLERALLVLGDAAARIPAGTLVEAFSRTGVETDELAELARTVRFAVNRVGGRAPRFDGWTGWLQFGHEALVAAVCGSGGDREYSVAVLLDTAGRAIASPGPAGIARMLVNARTVVHDFDDYERHWALDPNAPTTGDPFPEALTVIDALGSRFAFLRCWLLDRLAHELVGRELGAEALCVALSAAGDDVVSVDRTVSRYAGLLPAIKGQLSDVSAHAPRLPAALSDLIESIADPYLAARARLRLARLRGITVTAQQATTLAARLADPLNSLRLLELAHSLGVVPWAPSVAGAAWDYLTRLEGSPEHEPAHRRWAALSSALASPDTFRAAVREATEQPGTQTTTAGVMTADLMRPLDARRVPPSVGLPWVILTTATLCVDNLVLVRDTELEDLADWDDLLDPRTRAETALRMRHGTRFRPLPAGALPVIDRLTRESDEEIAAELLAHHRLPRNAAVFSDQWRTSRHRRLSDVATLLAIERGQLDVDAVSALPRLLSDRDERIRLRTGVAIRNRQRTGLPGGRFTAAGIGRHVLARLTEVTVDCRDRGKRANADLCWALNDIRHDSVPELVAALGLLSPDGRKLLLGSIRIVTAETLIQLPRLLTDLTDDAEQVQLLRSLDAMTIDTRTTGVPPAVIARAYEPLRAHLRDASDTVASCALELLGRVLPPDRATLEQFADQALRGMDPAVPGTVAVGAALGLGHLLRRFTGPEEDSAKALSTLRMIATGTHRRLAHAGVAGLLQVPGGNEFLDNALTARRLDGEDIMWGKLTDLDDYTDGPRYRAGLRTVSMFVREPAGISGQDRHDHNTLLVDALLDRAETLLDLRPGVRRHSLSEGMDDLADVLGVLVELADVQPAQLRVTVTDKAPALPTKLAALTRSGMWLHREFALRLLVLLGIGDRLSIDALLDSSTDTTLVKQAVLGELGWFDTIEPDGFSLLTTAVTSADLGRSHFAVQILTALLRHRALSEANHIAALRVLRKALERPDANETLWTEQDGRLHATGSFAEHVRANLAELLTGQPPATPSSGTPTVVLRVPDQHGNPLDLVTHTNADTTSSLSNQTSFYETTDRWPANDVFEALDVLMSKAKQAGVSWIAVLAGNNG